VYQGFVPTVREVLDTMVANLIIAESADGAIEEQIFRPAVRGNRRTRRPGDRSRAGGQKLLQRLEDGKPGDPDYHQALQ